MWVERDVWRTAVGAGQKEPIRELRSPSEGKGAQPSKEEQTRVWTSGRVWRSHPSAEELTAIDGNHRLMPTLPTAGYLLALICRFGFGVIPVLLLRRMLLHALVPNRPLGPTMYALG